MSDKQANFFQRTKAMISYLFTGAYGSAGSVNRIFQSTGNFENVNPITGGYLANDLVFQALRVYLQKAKVPPLILSKIVNQKALVKFQQFNASTKNQEHQITALLARRKALNEVEDGDHSLLNLLNNPNDHQSQSQLFESLLGYYKLFGNGYLYGADSVDEGVNAGKYKKLYVLESQNVTPVYSGDWKSPIAYYQYSIDGNILRLHPDHVCHLKQWNPVDKINGLSPIVPGSKIISADNKNKVAQARSFDNGGRSKIISSGSENKDLQWSKDQQDLVNEKLDERAKGADNYNNIFAVNRPALVQALGDSAVDMQLLEAAKHNRSTIPVLFGVWPVLVGDMQGGTENNVQMAYKALVTNTVVPDLIYVADELRRFLLKPYKNMYLDFDTTIFPELQPDLKLMKEVFGSPLITVDENRNLFNFDNFENKKWGSAVLVNSTLEPIDNILSVPSDMASIDEQIKELTGGY